MTKMENAKLCDEILRLFEGNKTVTWESLREKYGDGKYDYHIRENKINFLISDGQLERVMTADIKHALVLTSKGFATMTDLENLGYVSKEVEAEKKINQENFRFKLTTGLLILSILIAIIAIVCSK